MDQAAEPVTARELIKSEELARDWLLACCRWCERRPLPERAVRPVLVVVRRIGGADAVEMSAAQDQQPVETLAPEAADPTLGMCPRLRCSDWSLDDTDAC